MPVETIFPIELSMSLNDEDLTEVIEKYAFTGRVCIDVGGIKGSSDMLEKIKKATFTILNLITSLYYNAVIYYSLRYSQLSEQTIHL
jgi:hypothetical protein